MLLHLLIEGIAIEDPVQGLSVGIFPITKSLSLPLFNPLSLSFSGKLCWLLVALELKNLPANAGDIKDTNSVPGWGRSPGGGHGNPLQCSCLENFMDRGAWWASVPGVAKNWTQLRDYHFHFFSHGKYGRKPSKSAARAPPQWGHQGRFSPDLKQLKPGQHLPTQA